MPLTLKRHTADMYLYSAAHSNTLSRTCMWSIVVNLTGGAGPKYYQFLALKFQTLCHSGHDAGELCYGKTHTSPHRTPVPNPPGVAFQIYFSCSLKKQICIFVIFFPLHICKYIFGLTSKATVKCNNQNVIRKKICFFRSNRTSSLCNQNKTK